VDRAHISMHSFPGWVSLSILMAGQQVTLCGSIFHLTPPEERSSKVTLALRSATSSPRPFLTTCQTGVECSKKLLNSTPKALAMEERVGDGRAFEAEGLALLRSHYLGRVEDLREEMGNGDAQSASDGIEHRDGRSSSVSLQLRQEPRAATAPLRHFLQGEPSFQPEFLHPLPDHADGCLHH